MADFIQYHNVEKMGYEDISGMLVYSKKSVPEGSRVWLISGKGKPRTYHLRCVFVVDLIERGFDDENVISGEDGRMFEEPPELNDEPWFPAFKESQLNFKGGLCRIAPEFVDEFERFIR